MMRLFLCMLLLCAGAPIARAQDAVPPAPYANQQLADPEQERRAKALMETLRCITCQGQSIADSDATLAGDMRSLVRTRIAAGEDPEAIRAWLIARYGAWVSYDPKGAGAMLYLIPVIVLLTGAALAFTRFRRPAEES